MGVVDRLEVVQVQEEQAEGAGRLLRALQLPIQHQVQVARVEEVGEVVQVGQVLHLGDAAHVAQGERQAAREEARGLGDALGRRAGVEQDGVSEQILPIHRGDDEGARPGARDSLQHPCLPGHAQARREEGEVGGFPSFTGQSLRAQQPRAAGGVALEQHHRAGRAHPLEGGAGGVREPLPVERGGDALSGLQQRDVLAQRGVLPQQLARGERPVDGVLEHLRGHRLDEVLGGPALDGAHRRVHLVQAGDDHHLDARVVLPGVTEHLHPIPAGEDEVRHHRVVGVAGQRLLDLRDAADGGDLVARVPQVVLVQGTGELFVVDEQDARHRRRA